MPRSLSRITTGRDCVKCASVSSARSCIGSSKYIAVRQGIAPPPWWMVAVWVTCTMMFLFSTNTSAQEPIPTKDNAETTELRQRVKQLEGRLEKLEAERRAEGATNAGPKETTAAEATAAPEPKNAPSALKKDRKSTRLNSSHIQKSRMPSSA